MTRSGIKGVLVVDKSSEMTSHDVVAQVRRLFNIKRVGHTGTLDPFATGVLPVCIGTATRIAEYIVEQGKCYEAEMILGMRTDTQDITGTVTHRSEKRPTPEEIRQVLLSFVGEIEQIPPMYSAKKRSGVALYRLARQGIEVEREPRKVTIHAIEILKIEENRVRFTVHCSKGTYIRTLADDAGEKLGCFGTLISLRRIRVGNFDVTQAKTMEQLKEMGAEAASRLVIPMEDSLPNLSRFTVDASRRRSLIQGRSFAVEGEASPDPFAVYTGDRFLGIGSLVAIDGKTHLKMSKVLDTEVK